ncbi:hypothetical protein VZT92_020977 [Zoarces viviparus]|uniref:Claudin n=1 Tax=Zoarces viviparus TaxID=48416 RepID=A0AAW1EFV7_ZOAVI
MTEKLEVCALVLGFVGLVGTIAVPALPKWRDLWMICYREGESRMQCEAHDSLLILPPEMQAARGLMCWILRNGRWGGTFFIGWTTSGILLITGVILLFIYSKRRSEEEEPYTDTYLMEARDVPKEESVYLERTPSSFYKHHEYV